MSYDVNNKVHSGGWLKLEDGVNITSKRRFKKDSLARVGLYSLFQVGAVYIYIYETLQQF